jgi:hypothetical protein
MSRGHSCFERERASLISYDWISVSDIRDW